MPTIYSPEQLAETLIHTCLHKYKFIYVSGNGGAGKTTFASLLADLFGLQSIQTNYICMDEFVVDTSMRKSARKEWIDVNRNPRSGEYTTSFPESYYLAAPETIIHSIQQNIDCFYKLKKSSDFIRIEAKNPITIIEGVGAAFLEKNKDSLGIFMTCDKDIELDRRVRRARDGEKSLDKEETKRRLEERYDQFQACVLPHKNKFDIELKSLDDGLIIEKDTFGIFE